MTKPMSEDERVVREAWVFVQLYHREEGYRVKCGPLGGFDGAWVSNADEAWSLAAEYTRQRQREIAESVIDVDNVRVEARLYAIRVEQIEQEGEVPFALRERAESWKRILAREQAALAELQKGMVKK